MSINYLRLWARLNDLITIANSHLDAQNTIISDVPEVLDQYPLTEMEQVRDLLSTYYSDAALTESLINTQIFYVNRVLGELQVELSSPDTESLTILRLLALRMIEDNEYVNANVISTPAITPYSGNIGTGTVLVSTVNTRYFSYGFDDERIFDEKVQIRCTADTFTGSENAEFSIVGYPEYPRTSWRTIGHGSDILQEATASNELDNGDFEDFDGDDPGSWTIDAGTSVIQEETNDVYRGDSCLRLEADGSGTATLTQNLSLDKNRIYCLSVRMKKSAGLDGTSDLAIKLDTENELLDPPFEAFQANPTNLNTEWTLYHIFFELPSTREEDQLTVHVDWTRAGDVSAGEYILIDDIILSTPFEFGHCFYNIVPGSESFVQDDYIDIKTFNDYSGTINTFFARYYDRMLPSTAAGSGAGS